MISKAKVSVRASLVLAGVFTLAGCGGEGDDLEPPPPPPPLIVPSDTDAGAAQRPQVTLTVTNGAGVNGSIVITLLPEHAPVTVANFLNYVTTGFYVGTVFHRHDSNFVLQAGGYSAPVTANVMPPHKTTNAAIPLELKVSNVLGTVAMARTNVLNSATSEFYINIANNVALDTAAGGYAAFGYITEASMSVVNTMRTAPCVNSVLTTGAGCLPVPNIEIVAASQTR